MWLSPSPGRSPEGATEGLGKLKSIASPERAAQKFIEIALSPVLKVAYFSRRMVSTCLILSFVRKELHYRS